VSVKNACITSNGALTPSFRYIAKLRAQRAAAEDATPKAQGDVAVATAKVDNNSKADETTKTDDGEIFICLFWCPLLFGRQCNVCLILFFNLISFPFFVRQMAQLRFCCCRVTCSIQV
jgi:hypothetical protein